ncbi:MULTISPECIES: hypothetical protein [unclassified Mesorhizobium]|uniref:hypothetical protein n=1 Tax=unclassified Mesorhizobium TaxID=325217 RepID=UPI0006F9FCB2|nr:MULTISPECIES: hypothetical protein [unclassified Mesorhizobium]KQZ14533.1 hypothetical protein ASD27_10975 [Mesorhizobium sp. Root1471]KQZ37040.1 hypothetical protein ASD44_10965 [Mesorhizobium sp. Root554]MDR7034549.1 hypothetical protein [Mesorhizobium sp. BE184]
MKKFALAIAALVALNGVAFAAGESSNVLGAPTLAGQKVNQAEAGIDKLQTNSVRRDLYIDHNRVVGTGVQSQQEANPFYNQD